MQPDKCACCDGDADDEFRIVDSWGETMGRLCRVCLKGMGCITPEYEQEEKASAEELEQIGL